MEDGVQDICRVCRSEGSPDKPLYHPCVCTGSIKFIHQECLVQWLKYSKKEYCELCKHRFSFTPIYSPDMPRRLPIKDIITGLLKSVGRAIRYWFHYTLVAIAWLGIVPLTACRIYRCLFTGSVSSLLTLPMDMLSTENLLSDCFQGCFVVTCTLCAFISLVWLREQILHGGGPEWLEHDLMNHGVGNNIAAVAAGVLGNGGNNVVIGQMPPPAAAANAPDADAGADPAPENAAGVEEHEGQDNVGLGGAGNLGNNVAQEDNWIPIELDRAAEELTWERLLGLDGSLVFLEHVFWVVSLNTLFILVFAFCPYHIGHFIIIGMKSEDYLSHTQFEGLLTTLLGYLVIALSLVLMHTVFSIARLKRSKRVLGLCYIVIKVSLLVVIEIGIFPIFCGLWLDICSLTMFDASWKDREMSFRLAPGTLMFIHWLVGMVYVFYFASFILLLREVLRPGVLWFLRNLNDPDFNPIQEMIHLPIYRHIRRFIASMVIFGSTVIVMLWLPIRTVKYLMPNFLPYNVMLSSDAPVSELSLELLLLQVVLPALLEQGHTRQWLKNLVRGWCIAVSWVLDLRSFLLGDIPSGDEQNKQEQANDQQEENAAAAAPDVEGEVGQVDVEQNGENQENQENPEDAEGGQGEESEEEGEDFEEEEEEEDEEPEVAAALPPPGRLQAGLAAAHQALLQGGGPTGFQPYVKPTFFQPKLVALLVLMCITLFLASLISLIVPVFIGRSLMSLWMGEAKIHELYTAGCGLYTCWLTMRAVGVLQQWLPQGMGAVMLKIKEWTVLAIKSIVVASLLIGLVPLLIGLLFELVVVIPLRVPLDQTPIIFPWQDWALGVLHAKIACAITMMGPQSWLKTALEQMYNMGLRNMDLKFIIRELCIPVVTCLSLCLAGPYIIAKSIVPFFGLGFEVENLVLRHIYSFLVAVMSLISFCIFQARQFSRLYEHIKNDKYLVGQRLVNYNRPAPRREPDANIS